MSLLWVICGAGRGVGKTTLAGKLRQILPQSVYAKCGHSPAKDGRDGDYFRDLSELIRFVESAPASSQHTIVESNALAHAGRGDIVVFLDGAIGKTDFRADCPQLRARAHLIIDSAADPTDWERFLTEKLDPASLAAAICHILTDQQRFLADSQRGEP